MGNPTGCYAVSRFYLVLLNSIIFLLGCLFVGLSGWQLESSTNASENIIKALYFFMVLGLMLVIMALVGLIGATGGNQCVLTTFCSFMLVLIVGEAVIAWLCVANMPKLENMTRGAMEKTIRNYHKLDAEEKGIFDAIQHGLECCGANGPTDYIGGNTAEGILDLTALSSMGTFRVPGSCCKDTCEDESLKIRITDRAGPHIYSAGCYNKLKAIFVKKVPIVIGVCGAVLILQFIGLLAALYMFCVANRSDRYKE